MAVLKRGILGGGSGKIGNVVMSSWKGIDVAKTLPLSVANPRTAAQTTQRNSFKAIGQLASLMLVSIVKLLWDRFASKASGFNDFVRANIGTFADGVFTTFADFRISIGKLLGAADFVCIASEDNGFAHVEWTDNSGEGNASAGDVVFAAVYNETQDNWGYTLELAATRADGQCDVTMPSVLADEDVLHAYLAFRKSDGTIVSNTAYSTQTIAAG